jgi:hypothetical protein
MLCMNPLKLNRLDLKVQFDFASSLDWVLLEKPSAERDNGIPQSANELETIQVLKSYEKCEEYAKSHHINIPNVEELPSLENEREFRGLGALCQRLKQNLFLNMHQIPRTLRIPKGNRNWDDDECEFSDVLIGFEPSEYPFSNEALDLASNSPGCLLNFKV